jgi:hypothetical protein
MFSGVADIFLVLGGPASDVRARVVSCVIRRGLNAKLLTSEAGVNEVQDVRFRNHSEGDKTD